MINASQGKTLLLLCTLLVSVNETGARRCLLFCHGECLYTANEHEMFVCDLFVICDGDDMIKKSVAFTFYFQRAVKRLLSTAPAEIHVLWYGSLYSDGVLIMAKDRESCAVSSSLAAVCQRELA